MLFPTVTLKMHRSVLLFVKEIDQQASRQAVAMLITVHTLLTNLYLGLTRLRAALSMWSKIDS